MLSWKETREAEHVLHARNYQLLTVMELYNDACFNLSPFVISHR